MDTKGKSDKTTRTALRPHSVETKITVKKPYHAPKLFTYGKLRDLTMAPSPGMFESGLGSGFKGFP